MEAPDRSGKHGEGKRGGLRVIMAERLMKPRIQAINGPGFSLFLYSLLAVTIAITASCGLGYVPYLYPPADFSASGGSQLSLVHDVDNYDPSETTQSFKGYEIYYKAFDSEANAESLAGSIYDLEEDSTSSADSLKSKIDGFGMQRIASEANTGTKPLIQIAMPSTSHSFEVNLLTSDDWTLIENGTLLATLVRSDGSGDWPSFNLKDGYDSGDSDYSGEGSPDTVFFVFAAVAYGTDSSETIGDEIYSTPVGLGITTVLSINLL